MQHPFKPLAMLPPLDPERDGKPTPRPAPTSGPPKQADASPPGFTRLGALLHQPLPPQPCPACGAVMDQGFLIGTRPIYRHLAECPTLAAQEQADLTKWRRGLREQAAREWSNLPEGEELDLDGWAGAAHPETGAPYRNLGTEAGYTLAVGFRDAFAAGRPPRRGFTLCGVYGAGKSTLAAALGRSLVQQGLRLRFESVPRLYGRLLAANRDGNFEFEFHRLVRTPVLILDDLAREKATPWWVDQVLWPLIDARYVAGRPVVVTTNKPWREMQEKYERASSDREVADSAGSLMDRLMSAAAAVPFGTEQSQRSAGWDFLPEPEPEADALAPPHPPVSRPQVPPPPPVPSK